VYAEFAENVLAMPVIKGIKTANERFAGADETYCIEALMQDGKALQAGTSHFLGQNFAKAFDVKFTGKDGKLDYVWATSWGVSTRLMGALIMTHSDDSGLVLPPRIAPIQVVFIPIYRTEEEQKLTSDTCHQLAASLKRMGIRVRVDDKDTQKPGWKFAEYELKGVPLRVAVGPRDLAEGKVELARRDTGEKQTVPADGLADRISTLLDEIQDSLFQIALKRLNDNTFQVDDFATFKQVLDSTGGMISAHWDGTSETEEAIKAETKATIRCIPLYAKEEPGFCIFSGRPSNRRVIFARAY
jgi:prolyl-tRNA synthetase